MWARRREKKEGNSAIVPIRCVFRACCVLVAVIRGHVFESNYIYYIVYVSNLLDTVDLAKCRKPFFAHMSKF